MRFLRAFLALEICQRTRRGSKARSSTFTSRMQRFTSACWSPASAMAKRLGSPAAACSSESSQRPKAWKVATRTSVPAWPASWATRSRISAAALLVKVTARMAPGSWPRWSSQATRWAMTRVLPEPAPASTSSGPSVVFTASSCGGLSVERSSMVSPAPPAPPARSAGSGAVTSTRPPAGDGKASRAAWSACRASAGEGTP